MRATCTENGHEYEELTATTGCRLCRSEALAVTPERRAATTTTQATYSAIGKAGAERVRAALRETR